jgi:ATP-dependent DNA helicase RecQ
LHLQGPPVSSDCVISKKCIVMENQLIPYFENQLTKNVSVPRPACEKHRVPGSPTSGKLEQSLHEIFNISQLRPGQQEVIESILKGHDTLAIMPTGAGKSLCYQLPALNMPGATLVVSPLISLMKDQADKLEDVGIDTIEVNSTLNRHEQAAAMQGIKEANNEFIFTTPERLSDPEFIASLKPKKIDFMVIDEAHCISQWGHDFRPAFLELGAAINALHHPTVLALTATATDAVSKDIAQQLGIPDMRVINTGIYRPNLHYRVIQVTNEQEKLLEAIQLVQQTAGSGIIYAATIKAVEELYQALRQAEEQVTLYHGQLAAKERKRNQEAFMHGHCRLLVATNAFGMGIDKRDIRFVIHYQIPSNLETYYQESGRAGRDGAAACCTLLYYRKDKQVQEFFLARRYPGINEIIRVYARLQLLAATSQSMSLKQLRREIKAVSLVKLQVALSLLEEGGFIEQDTNLDYRLLKHDASEQALAQLTDKYAHRNKHDREALARMVFYAQTGFCRWKVLAEYFGEKTDWEHCGSCDNCLRSPASMLSAEHRIQHLPAAPRKKEGPLLKAGSPVRVAKFGEGHIISIAGDKITIVFPNSQTKTFMRDYVAPI